MKNDRSLLNVAEVKLSYTPNIKAKDRPLVNSANQAYSIFSSYWPHTIGLQEEFNMLLLDRSSRAIAFCNLSKGGYSATVVDLRIAFAAALKARADSIIIAHNHPSGSLKPSQSDIALTNKFKKASELIDIKLLDHIILSGEGGYYSFAENGLI